MKLTRLMLGLSFAVAASHSLGASGQDVQITSPPRKDSPSLSDQRRGSAPDAPGVENTGRRGLEDTVEILGVKEDEPDADGRRKVTVRVRYVLVHYAKGVLSLGFNLKSATKFVRVTDKPVEGGADEVELTATIVPVVWPKEQPFKTYVSLSAEPHPGKWSLLSASALPLKPAAAPPPARSDKAK